MSNKGFAALSPEKRKELASRGGKAVHKQGVGHEFTKEEAKAAGRKGGSKTKQLYGPDHYARMGKKGGKAPRQMKLGADA